jgi:hypothetical protein
MRNIDARDVHADAVSYRFSDHKPWVQVAVLRAALRRAGSVDLEVGIPHIASGVVVDAAVVVVVCDPERVTTATFQSGEAAMLS